MVHTCSKGFLPSGYFQIHGEFEAKRLRLPIQCGNELAFRRLPVGLSRGISTVFR